MAGQLGAVPERKDDLIVQKLGDEVIVYDRASHRAHSLNRTAALVFEKLDGKNDLAGVARQVGKALGRTQSEEIVTSAVNRLAAAGLLQPGAPLPPLPRRSVLRGLAAGLLPVVVSITVPPAANAQSGNLPKGAPCSPGQCDTGLFCDGATSVCCESPCAAGLGVCIGGECTGLPAGAPCTIGDTQCASGLCTTGVCA